jgi:hypothetical protein
MVENVKAVCNEMCCRVLDLKELTKKLDEEE